MVGKLSDGAECQVLLDTGTSESLCPSHITCTVKLYIPYKNMHLKLKEFK